jgi:hypothetical protein
MNAEPKAVQLKRTLGYRKPPGAIVVSRPSGWGNPYRVGHDGVSDASLAVALFEEWLSYSIEPGAQWMRANFHLLRGHDLVLRTNILAGRGAKEEEFDRWISHEAAEYF